MTPTLSDNELDDLFQQAVHTEPHFPLPELSETFLLSLMQRRQQQRRKALWVKCACLVLVYVALFAITQFVAMPWHTAGLYTHIMPANLGSVLPLEYVLMPLVSLVLARFMLWDEATS